MSGRTALVVGATGLVGKELVQILLDAPEYEKVIIWGRRTVELSHPKLVVQVIDFDKLENNEIEGQVDHVFCCLGTTIKKAKTQEAFKKVDLEYPLALARWAKKAGVSQFIVISAMGADANSKIFYNQTKGLLELRLKELGLNGLHIVRPSLLLGERSEFRFGESFAAVISKALPFLFAGSLVKYKPIPGKTVANAMYRIALIEKQGAFTFSSEDLTRF